MPADRLGRPMRDLRVSVTDRCNLRCRYCMPEAEYTWLPRGDVLTFDEVLRLVEVFSSLGTRKVRITGGEPLLRRGLAELVGMIAAVPTLDDVAMTTNGVLLADHAAELRAAGLRRVTVSLDTLDPARFTALSQRGSHAAVIRGLRAATEVGFTDTKIDTVVIRGVNDDELADLIEFAATVPAEVRFIEYMDVGGATAWEARHVVSHDEMVRSLADRYGQLRQLPGRESAPAQRYALPDGRTFGIVASTTQPFCAACDRSRLTADGCWFRCLYAGAGTDLRTPLRRGAGFEHLCALVGEAWRDRHDQGAVERLTQPHRGPVVPVSVLKRDPHLEMHTRGG